MKLFEPCTIGSVKLDNRLVMAPMSLNLNKDGFITDKMVSFYEERARGGVGLITIGDGIIDSPVGNNVVESTPIDDDKYIPALRDLTRAVHAHGVKIALQLSHGGRRAGRVSQDGYLSVTRGKMPVAPSPLPHPVPGQVVPRELSREEIGVLVEKFGEAARRTVDAGFDAIGLHCAHMYLCGEFLSPWSNQRSDEYGGDFEGRLRFVLEVIERIKKACRSACPLIVRMNGEEPRGGNTHQDIQEIARRFELAGVDAIHVSVGFGAPTKDPTLIPSVAPMRAPRGCIVPLAENIKAAVSIPVIAVNKVLGDIPYAESILQEGKADLIGLGRPLIADPMLPKKAREGRYEDIRPCIYCCQGCIQSVLERNAPVACSVNPVAGYETEKGATEPAARRKKVLVLGSGPAGIQAALTAAERGHQVTLVEEKPELGGQLRLACKPPGKGDIDPLITHLTAQLGKCGVEVLSGRPLTADVLQEIWPEAAVIATGSAPAVPDIPGLSGAKLVTARDVLCGTPLSGKNVVIIGGGQVGCEVAEYLCEQGKNVTVIELLDAIARGMPHINKIPLELALEKHHVRIITRAAVVAVDYEGVTVKCVGKTVRIPAEHVVVAVGAKPHVTAVETLVREKIPEVHMVGDRMAAGGILEAVRDGFDAGRAL